MFDYVKAVDKVVDLFEDLGFRPDKEPLRQFLLLMLTSAYKVKAVSQDLSNDTLGGDLFQTLDCINSNGDFLGS